MEVCPLYALPNGYAPLDSRGGGYVRSHLRVRQNVQCCIGHRKDHRKDDAYRSRTEKPSDVPSNASAVFICVMLNLHLR